MSERNYRLGRLRGQWAVVWNEPDGRRPRHTLGTSDRKEAERLLDRFVIEQAKPEHVTVSYLWDRYRQEHEGRPIAESMRASSGKAILPVFGGCRPEDVTADLCKSYIASRRKIGRRDGAIWTELNHLQVVLSWALKRRLTTERIHVVRPSKPDPRDRRLTKKEAERLVRAAEMPHIQLAIALMLGTGARRGAVLDLTWDRVDLERGLISYARTEPGVKRKGRATVPIAPHLLARLTKAKEGAVSDHVIEWAGKPVKSIKRGFAYAVAAAGLTDVSPHVLRHTAASLMAEDGIPMGEIAAMLGHSDSRTTERIYAKFSPTYLRQAASVLDIAAEDDESDVPSSPQKPKTRNGKQKE